MIETDEIGRKVFEEMLQGTAFSWSCDGNNDTHLVSMTKSGTRVRLRIDQGAIDQAAHEPELLPRLKMEVERALRVSESGTAIGFVIPIS
jgi:hypothetical protein